MPGLFSRIIAAVPVLLLAFSHFVLVGAAESVYALPERIEAHRFRLDLRSLEPSSVLVDFSIGPDGHPVSLRTLQAQEPLRLLAPSLLRGWSFTLLEDTPVDARVALFMLARQPRLLPAEPALRELSRPELPAGPSPPYPRRIVEPSHPPQVPTDGLVVLGIVVTREGKVERTTQYFGPREFVAAVEEVIHVWEFEPARQKEEPVPSNLVIVVYFSQPSL